MRRLLLISNSTTFGGQYLGHCEMVIREQLTGCSRILFVPWALHDHEAYAAKARERFREMGFGLDSAHEVANVPEAIETAEAMFIGGGNTFRLLARMIEAGIMDPIRRRVAAGMPYIGSSAGSNVATVTIRTTNDMPIVQPPTFDALGLVPFNINPHYLDPDPDGRHMGETREERIFQFHEENDVPVVGLREGSWLTIGEATVELGGTARARLFRRGKAPEEFEPGARLDFLV